MCTRNTAFASGQRKVLVTSGTCTPECIAGLCLCLCIITVLEALPTQPDNALPQQATRQHQQCVPWYGNYHPRRGAENYATWLSSGISAGGGMLAISGSSAFLQTAQHSHFGMFSQACNAARESETHICIGGCSVIIMGPVTPCVGGIGIAPGGWNVTGSGAGMPIAACWYGS